MNQENDTSLRLPHFFLFKDLFYSHLEAKNLLQQVKDGQETFTAQQIKPLAQHYLVLFEILEFLHEYTPDFFVITKIQDEQEEIICFSNQEFSKTFGISHTPEGKDIFHSLSEKEQKVFRSFMSSEIKSAKEQLEKSGKQQIEISEKSDTIEMPLHHKKKPSMYDVHVRLVGTAKYSDNTEIFEGYSILLGRDITHNAVQDQIANTFTNIPPALDETFRNEAFRRKVLGFSGSEIEMKNSFVLSGVSDISQSSKMRKEAEIIDKENKNHDAVKDLNTMIDTINHFLYCTWKEAQKHFDAIEKGAFIFDATDGLDYMLCFSQEKKSLSQETIRTLKQLELRVMADITRSAQLHKFPLKHLIISHNTPVHLYFDERTEKRFKVATDSVDICIRKKYLEKSLEKNKKNRIIQEGTITVVVENKEDEQWYQKEFEKLEQEGVFSAVEQGDVENLHNLEPSRFLRGKVCVTDSSFLE